MKRIAGIVSLAATVAAALNLGSTATAAPIAVRVVPPFPLERFAGRGAVGLLVPGSGSKVSRAGALAALRVGKTRPAALGGLPSGRDRIAAALAAPRGDVTVYVSLPPAGTHRNDRRYPIAVVGGGYHGLLTSTRTHIPGLISVADVAPTVEAFECSGTGCPGPTIRSRADADGVEELQALERGFDELHASRRWARIVLFTAALVLAAAALLLHSRLLARAALVVPATVLAAAELLSAIGESRPGLTAPVLAAAALAAIPLARLPLAAVFTPLLAALLVVLLAWPDVPALAALGPHPEGGGRFYGVTNSVETILIAPALLAGAALGPLWIALLATAVVVAGVDGGGILVFFAAFLALALRLRRPYQAAALPLLGALAAVGAVIARAAGHELGSNHVADAASGGPGALFHDVTRRWHLSYAAATSSTLTLVLFLACLAALVAVARSRPRWAVLDAFLLGLLVSFVFNDAPNDVARFGALSAASLWAWKKVRGEPLGRGR